MATAGATTGAVTTPFARVGLWLLPAYGVLLAGSTLTHQPDYTTDFAGYADYVTTDVFLVSHLVASIGGAALGLVGVVALLAHLVRSTTARLATIGAALTIAGTVLNTSVFGAAAFAQPAIGRAYLRGVVAAEDFNADVYSGPLFVTVSLGLLMFMAGSVALGIAIARTSARLRWAGIGYATGLTLFVVLAFTISVLQPVAALIMVAATVVVALRLPSVTP